jgi:hypothetical protein
VITPGKYNVLFRTPVGEGAGLAEFGPDGKLHGGDHTFAYDGSWTQEAGRFKAALRAKRVVPGPPGVFGVDEVDIVVVWWLLHRMRGFRETVAGAKAGSRVHPR